MGTGCVSVSRVQTEGTELVVGTWKGGRIGTFRGIRAGKADYGALAFGTKGIVHGQRVRRLRAAARRGLQVLPDGPRPGLGAARRWRSSPSWRPPTRASAAAACR